MSVIRTLAARALGKHPRVEQDMYGVIKRGGTVERKMWPSKVELEKKKEERKKSLARVCEYTEETRREKLSSSSLSWRVNMVVIVNTVL